MEYFNNRRMSVDYNDFSFLKNIRIVQFLNLIRNLDVAWYPYCLLDTNLRLDTVRQAQTKEERHRERILIELFVFVVLFSFVQSFQFNADGRGQTDERTKERERSDTRPSRRTKRKNRSFHCSFIVSHCSCCSYVSLFSDLRFKVKIILVST